MNERNIAAEVLEGLREVQAFRAGKRTLRTTRVPSRDGPRDASTDPATTDSPESANRVRT